MNEYDEADLAPGTTDYDVVVVGGGAAGLSAALVLTRARRRVVVVDSGHPRNAPAAQMHGFLGSDGLPPGELLAAGHREVLGYGGALVSGVVTDVRIDIDERHETPKIPAGPSDARRSFVVTLADGRVLHGRRVLVTTGLRDEVPDIPGVRLRWGRDLLHCPYCHGYEVRDQRLGVLGGTSESVAHALLVRQWSDDVVYFANGADLAADQRERLVASGVDVIDEPVARLVVENDRLTGVALASGTVVSTAAVFVRPVFAPHDALLNGLGCEIGVHGWVTVDATGRTSVPGVWAAGNAVNPRAQVITAAGEASAAAIDINNDLVDEDTQNAVTRHRLGLPA